MRTIVHMDLDAFFVSVSRLEHPRLVGKPVIIGGTSDRGVVSACSYEARAFGVHSAMPIKLARRLCPDALIVRGDYERYAHYSDVVTEMIGENVPLYEKSSIDEFYLDLTGMDRFFGCYKWATSCGRRSPKRPDCRSPWPFAQQDGLQGRHQRGETERATQDRFRYRKTFPRSTHGRQDPDGGEKTFNCCVAWACAKCAPCRKCRRDCSNACSEKRHHALESQRHRQLARGTVFERKSISTEETFFDQDTIDVRFPRSPARRYGRTSRLPVAE